MGEGESCPCGAAGGAAASCVGAAGSCGAGDGFWADTEAARPAASTNTSVIRMKELLNSRVVVTILRYGDGPFEPRHAARPARRGGHGQRDLPAGILAPGASGVPDGGAAAAFRQ